MRAVILAGMVALVLAGCIADTPGGRSPIDDEAVSASQDDPVAVAASWSHEALNLLGCQQHVVGMVYPAAAYAQGDDVPEAWSAGGKARYTPQFNLMHCEKIVWDDLARGPIVLGWDEHNYMNLPETCSGGSRPSEQRFVHQILISDEEVATRLEAVGAPAKPWSPTLTIETAGDLDTVEVTWTDGSYEGRLFFITDWKIDGGTPTGGWAHAWATEDQTAGLLTYEGPIASHAFASRAAEGTVPPRYILGQSVAGASPIFLMDASFTMDYSITLSYGRGYTCE